MARHTVTLKTGPRSSLGVTCDTRREAWLYAIAYWFHNLLVYAYLSTDGTYKWCLRGFIPDDEAA